ncbi:alanine racemase [Paenibacillus ehimensis]|uniref:Alanine racemase n=1 Tax=Paenibacillus ehimensis TaxID=79264 RepID=A0ABT8VFA4_9BACL|nr:alanine racemase [Paenibacillus ehimensis]MDO3679655.1 alanine racemase [Paenibacillus ehimensis]MEC0213396.1 alanine racemase [Paenibacillus ehimensis]
MHTRNDSIVEPHEELPRSIRPEPDDADWDGSFSHRPTLAEISLDAIASNAAYFHSLVRPGCQWMAVVKANGYGHGAVETARTALSAGADRLGVAFLDEALRLRSAGIAAPILVLGYTPPEAIREAVAADVTLTVFRDEALEAVMREAESLGRAARIHLKMETGMNRLGVTSADAALRLARRANESPYVTLEGAFTHFANADHPSPAYTELQFARFLEFRGAFEEAGVSVPLWHCCNTAATIAYPHMHLDMVRVGIGLYGLKPSVRGVIAGAPLKPAMRLKSQIVSLKDVPALEPVSYGCTFASDKDTKIATVPIGYADGMPRALSNKGTATVRGQSAPIAGTICMDQLMLDVTSIPDAKLGDEVLLFGTPEDKVTAADVASHAHTIHYEIVCGIGARVPRVYVQEGRTVSTRFI